METKQIQKIGDGRIVIDGETYVNEKSGRVMNTEQFEKAAKNNFIKPDVIWRSEQLAISALQKILDMQRVYDSYADTCSTMRSVASGALAEIDNCK